jgi:hypothetical protein
VPGTGSELEAEAGALATPTVVASERVERPDPGLARGRWEAQPALFYAVAAATLIGGVIFAIVTSRKTRR